MQLKMYDSLKEIAQVKWENLEHGDFPFSRYAFLLALEKSGCVGGKSGWLPAYLTLWEDNTLIGAMYLYEKNHSYGEYIFDWQWAAAYERCGEPYYPKMLSAVPFTPATGPKILVHGARDKSLIERALLTAARDVMTKRHCKSFHVLFIPEQDVDVYREQGFMIRHTFQYHWKNRGYRTFDDFLKDLKGDKRKNILKERREVNAQAMTIEIVTGDALRIEHARAMYQFYRSTIEKMRAIPYLTLNFFERVITTMPNHVVLCLARSKDSSPDQWVAGALNFKMGRSLFGRYWGCLEEFSFLHFELCYYQTVEYAIANDIQLFEAGAQGDHKLRRGFLPNLTYSAHFLQDQRFHNAIELYTKDEARALAEEIEAAKSHYPFKETPS